MRLARFHLWLILASSGGICFGQVRSADQEMKSQAKAEIDKEMHGLPSLGEHDLDQAIGFVLRGGKLHPFTPLALPDSGTYTLKIKDLTGAAKIQATPDKENPDWPRMFTFCVRDLGAAGTVVVYTDILSGPDSLNVSQGADLPDDESWTVQFLQTVAPGPLAVNLWVQRTPRPAKRYSAATLAELCWKYPAEVDTYLRPIFRFLRQEQTAFQVDPKTAFQVLCPLWRADAATAATADAAVTALGADSYSDREAAMGRLRALGEPAALYLMRADSTRLSAEQAMRVDLFLAPYRPLADEDATRLQSDADFLLDCQFSSDADIRHMALDQLRRVSGTPIGLDTKLNGPLLGAAVTKLRQSLTAPK
jgi:hypothetical protein